MKKTILITLLTLFYFQILSAQTCKKIFIEAGQNKFELINSKTISSNQFYDTYYACKSDLGYEVVLKDESNTIITTQNTEITWFKNNIEIKDFANQGKLIVKLLLISLKYCSLKFFQIDIQMRGIL
jgi:hypothetical protein